MDGEYSKNWYQWKYGNTGPEKTDILKIKRNEINIK